MDASSVPAEAAPANGPAATRVGTAGTRTRARRATPDPGAGPLGRHGLGDVGPRRAREVGRRPTGAGAAGAARHPGVRGPADALGRCQVDLMWTAVAGTAYRVLRQRRDDVATAPRTPPRRGYAGRRAEGPLARPAVHHARRDLPCHDAGLFDRTSFELLMLSVLLATTAGRMSYRHEVSGSLDVLVFYKVLPVAVLETSPQLQLGGETAFGSLDAPRPRGAQQRPAAHPAADGPAEPPTWRACPAHRRRAARADATGHPAPAAEPGQPARRHGRCRS